MLDPKHLPLRRILDYWRTKKGERPAASRAEIDPAEIRSLLPYVGLVDVEGGAAQISLSSGRY